MKIVKIVCIAICALSLLSCNKIPETLTGTQWESTTFISDIDIIEFTSDTRFTYTTFSETVVRGIYRYEYPNIELCWQNNISPEYPYDELGGFVDGDTLTLYDSKGNEHTFIRCK